MTFKASDWHFDNTRAFFITDDKDVVDLSVAKAWADPAGIWFRVDEIGGRR